MNVQHIHRTDPDRSYGLLPLLFSCSSNPIVISIHQIIVAANKLTLRTTSNQLKDSLHEH